MDLDEVADELYAVPPDEFTALRTARQDDARAAGDRALVKAIGGLPKPSTAAWVCNLLAREKRPEVEGLIELGQLLREAQEKLSGEEMRALNAQRTKLISALTRQATGLARERGHRVSTAIADQVEDTLRAALADPEAGEALLSGRLTSGLSYSGLGTATARPDLRLVPPAKPEKKAEPKAAPRKPAGRTEDAESAAQRREREREERRKAAEEKRRRELAEAQQAAEEARAAAAEARTAADEQRRDVEEAEARHAELQARVEELADQLAEAERAEAEAAVALKRVQRRTAAADREAAEATETLERAVARVQALEGE